MKHSFGHRKLGMNTSHRRATLRNMTTSMLLHERINTTLAKAKEVRILVEKMVTLGKRGDLHARRQALSYLFDKEAAQKLFAEYSERFKDQPGGYTRIIKKGPRLSDGAEEAILEFVDYKIPGLKEEKTEKKAAKKA